MKALSLAAMAAAGYVLGSRAGRERYEQIMAAAASASQRLESYGNGGRFASGDGRGSRAKGRTPQSR
jgi:hypothetical protein